jgi:hypothetical protein
MKIFYLGVLVILAVGCVTPTPEKPTLDMVRARNASSLLKINIGMDKKEVLEIMGTETIQTYFYSTQMVESRVIPNPYRTEIRREDDKVLEVIYYYTDFNFKKKGEAITDDELTPLVFENGKLIGWGWSFFEEEVNKYKIEIPKDRIQISEKIDPEEIVSLEEVPLANTIEQEALVNILIKKGLINKKELLEEIKRLKKEYYK